MQPVLYHHWVIIVLFQTTFASPSKMQLFTEIRGPLFWEGHLWKATKVELEKWLWPHYQNTPPQTSANCIKTVFLVLNLLGLENMKLFGAIPATKMHQQPDDSGDRRLYRGNNKQKSGQVWEETTGLSSTEETSVEKLQEGWCSLSEAVSPNTQEAEPELPTAGEMELIELMWLPNWFVQMWKHDCR